MEYITTINSSALHCYHKAICLTFLSPADMTYTDSVDQGHQRCDCKPYHPAPSASPGSWGDQHTTQGMCRAQGMRSEQCPVQDACCMQHLCGARTGQGTPACLWYQLWPVWNSATHSTDPWAGTVCGTIPDWPERALDPAYRRDGQRWWGRNPRVISQGRKKKIEKIPGSPTTIIFQRILEDALPPAPQAKKTVWTVINHLQRGHLHLVVSKMV